MSKIIKKIKECGGCARRRKWIQKQKEKALARIQRKSIPQPEDASNVQK